MQRQGFTLLEISIVIAIIGLLIGGVVIGSSMVRAAQTRSILSDAQRYTQAISNFRDKYMAMPGDYAGASSFWFTNNGDGNGRITTYNSGATYAEQFYAWHHLSFAGFVEHTYLGVAGPGGVRDRVPGTNVPKAKLNGGWGLLCVSVADIAAGYGDMPYLAGDIPPDHVLWLGGNSQSPGTNDRQAPLLSGDEARDIDEKVDDGFSNSGRVVMQINASPCIVNTSSFSTTKDKFCNPIFKTGL